MFRKKSDIFCCCFFRSSTYFTEEVQWFISRKTIISKVPVGFYIFHTGTSHKLLEKKMKPCISKSIYRPIFPWLPAPPHPHSPHDVGVASVFSEFKNMVIFLIFIESLFPIEKSGINSIFRENM